MLNIYGPFFSCGYYSTEVDHRRYAPGSPSVAIAPLTIGARTTVMACGNTKLSQSTFDKWNTISHDRSIEMLINIDDGAFSSLRVRTMQFEWSILKWPLHQIH